MAAAAVWGPRQYMYAGVGRAHADGELWGYIVQPVAANYGNSRGIGRRERMAVVPQNGGGGAHAITENEIMRENKNNKKN